MRNRALFRSVEVDPGYLASNVVALPCSSLTSPGPGFLSRYLRLSPPTAKNGPIGIRASAYERLKRETQEVAQWLEQVSVTLH
jgi:hypothetical protein